MGDLSPQLTVLVGQRSVHLPALALLSAPQTELEEQVCRALRDNPMLTRAPGGPCAGCGRHCPSGRTRCHECLADPLPSHSAALMNWRDDLLTEARLDLPAAKHRRLAQLVAALDEHGWLPPDAWPGREPGDEAVLAALRRVGPPGIAAASGAECVLLQVDALVATGRLPAIASVLLTEHADRLAAGDHEAIAQALRIEHNEMIEIVSAVRARVSPFPAVGEPGPRVVPDVIYRRGEHPDAPLVVEVAGPEWFGITMDRQTWAAADGPGRGWLRGYREEARTLLGALRVRAGLLTRLAVHLAQAQESFLRHGSGHRPLTRTATAAVLGCHPATVTRLVTGKCARCPDGRIVALADCYGRRTSALTAVAQARAEHPDASDAALSAVLAERGVEMARRTVAKYRHLLDAR